MLLVTFNWLLVSYGIVTITGWNEIIAGLLGFFIVFTLLGIHDDKQ